jgi:colanic acid/amylovoran biosynthesis glycosyltransferase
VLKAGVTATGSSDRPPFGVIVDHQVWLPLTNSWIHTQAACLPSHVTPHVVCVETANLRDFTLGNFHAYSQLSWPARLAVHAAAFPKIGSDALSRKSAMIARVARRHGAEVVHSHFGYTGVYSMRAVRKLGLKHVVTFYGVDMSALPASDARWIERYRLLFSQVHQVLCEGPRMADAVARLGCPAEKLRVQHLGVRLEKIDFKPRTWRSGEPLKVLIAASFREKKGIPYALEALARIKDEVRLEITIVGDAGANPRSLAEKARIHSTVAKCSLAPNVRFVGYQPWHSLLEDSYRHHVYLSPSVTAADGDTEGGAPVGLIEMAATGMPVVSSRHADIPEVIEDGVGGLLAAERDVDGLANCLRRLTADPSQWIALASAARRRIEREFDAVKQGERLAGIYERVRNG